MNVSLGDDFEAQRKELARSYKSMLESSAGLYEANIGFYKAKFMHDAVIGVLASCIAIAGITGTVSNLSKINDIDKGLDEIRSSENWQESIVACDKTISKVFGNACDKGDANCSDKLTFHPQTKQACEDYLETESFFGKGGLIINMTLVYFGLLYAGFGISGAISDRKYMKKQEIYLEHARDDLRKAKTNELKY